jgi:hypothetical protein
MTLAVEYFTLTPVDATNQYISLNGVPVAPTSVALDIVSGTCQALPGDFGVDGTKVVWDNPIYRLNSSSVEAGDEFRVIYDRS